MNYLIFLQKQEIIKVYAANKEMKALVQKVEKLSKKKKRNQLKHKQNQILNHYLV
jgi:hypothetical protein